MSAGTRLTHHFWRAVLLCGLRPHNDQSWACKWNKRANGFWSLTGNKVAFYVCRAQFSGSQRAMTTNRCHAIEFSRCCGSISNCSSLTCVAHRMDDLQPTGWHKQFLTRSRALRALGMRFAANFQLHPRGEVWNLQLRFILRDLQFRFSFCS